MATFLATLVPAFLPALLPAAIIGLPLVRCHVADERDEALLDETARLEGETGMAFLL